VVKDHDPQIKEAISLVKRSLMRTQDKHLIREGMSVKQVAKELRHHNKIIYRMLSNRNIREMSSQGDF